MKEIATETSKLNIGKQETAILFDISEERTAFESISIDSLLLEESIIDEAHCNDLVESMSGKRGQISPITVRVRMDENQKLVYDIIDGFHRAVALKRILEIRGEPMSAYAVVVYGCSDEELYDLRVLSVNSALSVSFPRLITWMQRSYEQTPWYQKGLTMSQTMSIAYQDTSGSYLGLTIKEAKELKEWAKEKSRKWNKSIGAIYQDIKAVENADPELVKLVRIGGGGGHDKKGMLNPARFRAMVDELPGQYKLQRFMVDLITRFNLDQNQTRLVARKVADARENPELLELIKVNPLAIIGEFESEDIQEEETSGQTGVENIHSSKTKIVSLYPAKNGGLDGYRLPGADENQDASALRQAIFDTHQQLETQTGGNPFWFETIPELSVIERDVSVSFFREGRSVDEMMNKYSLTANRVYQLLQSITQKYFLSREDQRLKQMAQNFKN